MRLIVEFQSLQTAYMYVVVCFLLSMQEAVVQAQQAETELQQKIVRETAELTKVCICTNNVR